MAFNKQIEQHQIEKKVRDKNNEIKTDKEEILETYIEEKFWKENDYLTELETRETWEIQQK